MAENWPDWRISLDNVAELARYVDISYPRTLVPQSARGPWDGPSEGRDRAQLLYDELLDRRIAYDDEPLDPRGYRRSREAPFQRIRGPRETVHGSATCLDLTLVYAGMALCAGIRPRLALRMGEESHALVILDVRKPLTDMRIEKRNVLPCGVERGDDPGIWDLSDGAALAQLASMDGWLLVDVVRATRRDDSPGVLFSEASGWRISEELVGSAGGTHQWTLVDVSAVVGRDGFQPYSPPTDRAIPATHSYLPTAPPFTVYPSRGALFGELRNLTNASQAERPAVLVLQSPPGFGKTMLAHHLATMADHGYGWFLDASDPGSLMASLAGAERQETGLPDEQAATLDTGERPDPVEMRALASAALERLRHTERSWVVVLDGCDILPDSPGLQELIPLPHHPGQTVIITTTVAAAWHYFAAAKGWVVSKLSGLDVSDLRALDLPPGVFNAIGGRPLIAEALVALRDHGAVIPEQTDLDGPELAWELLHNLPGADPVVVATARLLAWCPPEALAMDKLFEAASHTNGDNRTDAQAVGHTLARLRFAAPFFQASGMAIQMHPLFAEAVRAQTWRDRPASAADAIEHLLTSKTGQDFFISAAEETALDRLEHGPDGEPGDADRAAEHLADQSRRGLLCHGLGRIRERRGQVRWSADHFSSALSTLSVERYPLQTGESMIGLARRQYQAPRGVDKILVDARKLAEEGCQILERLATVEAQQLCAQGNALAWLITQRLAVHEPDLPKRAEMLAEVRYNLWLSYERRRRILRPDYSFAPRSAPVPADGLGAERAFYNLAGTNLLLAQTRFQIAEVAASGAGDPGAVLAEVAFHLDEAARVYEVVRALRERRYTGRAHPHLAACVHGQALVAYYRAALLGEVGQFAAAFEFASTALEQRLKIASGLLDVGSAKLLQDNDVRKSVEFMFRLSAAATAGPDDQTQRRPALERMLNDTFREFDASVFAQKINLGVRTENRPAIDRRIYRLDATTAEMSALDLGAVLARARNLLRDYPEVDPENISGQPSAIYMTVAVRIGPLSEDRIDSIICGIFIEALELPPNAGRSAQRMRPTVRMDDSGGTPRSPEDRESGGPSLHEAAPVGVPAQTPLPHPYLPGSRNEEASHSTPATVSGVMSGPPRRRYLLGQAPDTIRTGKTFSLLVRIALSHGGAMLKSFIVPPEGLDVLLVAHAPGLRLLNGERQTLRVPAVGDSDPVMFELVADSPGARRISITAWRDGNYLGELLVEVTAVRDAPEGQPHDRHAELSTDIVDGAVTLEVRYDPDGNAYRFQFHDIDNPRGEVHFLSNPPGPLVEELVNDLARLAEGSVGYSATETREYLVDAGARLWQRLLPQRVREQFWERQQRIRRLTIIADRDVVPWELLYPMDHGRDDLGFLVEQFPVTRDLFERPPLVRSLRLHPAHFVHPPHPLEAARAEIAALSELVGARESPETVVSQFTPLRTLISQGGFGLLHFACHNSFSAAGGCSINLDNRPFTVTNMELVRINRSLRSSAPLIFINACRTAGLAATYNGLDGWAEAFMQAGAGAFIGSLWAVTDGAAREFAQEFYRQLQAGGSLGEAVTAARRSAASQPGDPTWLAYTVYGDPRATLSTA